MRRWVWGVCGFWAITFAAAVFLAEGAIHPPRLHRPAAHAQEVFITAKDGTRLDAWWISPARPNGSAVIVCHGVGDSAYGALGFAPFLLKNGYSVLAPDSRGHGESLGFVTYGVRESGDVAQWVSWVQNKGVQEVFGLGESLGGAILIQSLAQGAQFRAIVAESSYSSFEAIADERVSRVVPGPLAWLIVREALLYVRVRYGVDLAEARPDRAIAQAHVPILLIHGTADQRTKAENSIRMAGGNSKFVRLWLVPGAGHTGAYAADPKEFEEKVLQEFR